MTSRLERERAHHDDRFSEENRAQAACFYSVTSYTYRLERQWEHLYSTRGARRELAARKAHRNVSANLNYTPAKRTSLTLRTGRSVQRSGAFDSFSVTLSRRV